MKRELEPSGRGDKAKSRWRVAVGGMLLGLAVWGIYGGTGRHEWVGWDDNVYIYENEMVKRGLTWEGVKWAWTTGEAANWHPLTWLSLMLDRELFGDWAGGGHLETAALHWGNALLLWWALGRLTGRKELAWWVALLWAVHPLRVESVAWASERKDVLAVLFGLAAVGTYVGGRERRIDEPTSRRTDEMTRGEARGRIGRGRMWGVAGWMAASLACKPMLVTLPCLLLLLDGWPMGRWRRVAAWRLVREKWMLWALVMASCCVTLIVQKEAMSSLAAVGMGERVATALMAYGWYLEKWVWPTGLAFFYPRSWAGVTWSGAMAWGVVLLGAGVAAVWAWKRKGWGWACAGWFWFLGTLVPMIGIVQVGQQVWADRYMYWPEIGLWTMAVFGAGAAWRAIVRRQAIRRVAVVAALAMAVALGWAAREQAATWKDNASLFGRALAVTTGNAPAEGNWGTELARAGCWVEARGHLESAVALERGNGTWWYQLGTVRWNQGERAGALEAWKRAVHADRKQWEAMNNLSWGLLKEGRVEEARMWIDRAMEHEAAREDAAVQDTDAAVRRAEGEEDRERSGR